MRITRVNGGMETVIMCPGGRTQVYGWASVPRRCDVPAERPTVQGDLESARALRDTLVALGGRPTRQMKTVPLDPINPEYESDEMFAAPLRESSYWGDELYLWKRFVRWRKWVSDSRPKDTILEFQSALPPDPPVDAYPLHIEFRAYLLERIEEMATFPPPPWENERKRLGTLEEQLAQMIEKGLPPDDNPLPPALVAILGPRHIIRPPSPESPPPPPPPQKRKRKQERGGEDQHAHKTKGDSTGGAADEVAGKAPTTRPPAERRATRRTATAEAVVTETPPPRRSTRITALPRKNYKV
ncbi:hypothetical protein C8A05DRAFT_46801 [Staphylotrichum tortipilum]|uniref:Uncharacterized protein n=1 Tax=Staphylotrichum tortipilum TaxID=2831512 RepID=A0AAN6MDY7_9PEZI|nr:hypothetical protein C8A05DRAFT_46801 [Staphylotrichum longicolle]